MFNVDVQDLKRERVGIEYTRILPTVQDAMISLANVKQPQQHTCAYIHSWHVDRERKQNEVKIYLCTGIEICKPSL